MTYVLQEMLGNFSAAATQQAWVWTQFVASALNIVALVHGGYYILTGVWPLLSIRTFMAVTGPKMDQWLVKTVGLLVTAIGGVFLSSAIRNQIHFETILLAISSAIFLASIDVYYVVRQIIPRIYLGDALAEVVLIVAWLLAASLTHLP